METRIPVELIQTLERQEYHLIGRHSAVKRCRWLHQALTNGRSCYKQKFYGIQTHRCIQMTPTAFYCTQHCIFCWRAQNTDLKLEWNELAAPDHDEPGQIVEASILAQRRILSGYKANPKTDLKKLKEAQAPNQAAISLAGEPTLYKRLGQLLQAFHRKKIHDVPRLQRHHTICARKTGRRTDTTLHISMRPRQENLHPSLPPTNSRRMEQTQRDTLASA